MVTFANGITLDTIAVYGGNMQYQNAQRKTLEIVCASSVISLDDAKALWTNVDATKELTVSETTVQPVAVNTESGEMVVSGTAETVTSVHLNFTIPVELRLMMKDNTEVVKIKLAQKSTLELAQEQQAAELAITQMAILELAQGTVTVGGE